MPDASGSEKSGVDLYFLDRDGGSFKATMFYEPYFYLDVSDPRRQLELTQHLQKRFEGSRAEPVDKEDLDMINHLAGKQHKMIKLSFGTVAELMDAKTALRPILTANQKRAAAEYLDEEDAMDEGSSSAAGAARGNRLKPSADPLSFLSDMREFDVPYTMRVAIGTYEVPPQLTLMRQSVVVRACVPL